jgi:3-deoxy-D-manno-octulosonic-acid transferase
MKPSLLSTLSLAAQLLVYDLVLLALVPLAVLWLGWRGAVKRKPVGNILERLGLVPRLPAGRCPRIWIHAVSAGEMAAARPVIAELRRRFPGAGIAVSTHTDTGMALARNICDEVDVLFYLPFDWPDTMVLALWRLRPQLILVVEKELWPNMLALGRLFGARVLAVNGRVSDRMMSRARWLPGFVRWLYRLTDRLCVQSATDAERLRRIAPGSRVRVVVAGNTKADTLAARDRRAEERVAQDIGALDSHLWLVAGSTHPGEEEQIVDAFVKIREKEPRARLLLAPRHVDRVAQVSAMLAQRGLHVVRRSEGREDHAEAVVILDTMGELRAAYALGAAGFVGGTLVAVGGHNLLEPTAVGVASLFGPHTENCSDTADLLSAEGVGFAVGGPEELAREFLRLAGDDARRREIARRAGGLIARQRGASFRCAEVAAELLEAESSK